jgi:two-component system NtrC family sensor kinase
MQRIQVRSASTPANTAGLSRDLFESAFESLPMAVLVFDKRLEAVLRNQAAKDLIPKGADLSRSLSELTVESRYEDWAAELRKVIDTQLPRRIDVTVRRGAQEPDTYLNILIHPLRGADGGETIGGLLLAEDVTAHIGMERRLAVSERLAAVGKLAARVAHELNNPLDGILRYTNLAIRIAAENPADAKIGQYLEQVRSGILRMSEIIRDLLEFSRSTPGAIEQATINKIVEDSLSAMEGRAQHAHITTVCNFHQTDMPVVRGSNLFQIFCNLIKNAVEAMPNGGTLTLTTKLAEPDVIVTIEDTGVGLPSEAHRIFEPFFTTKAVGHGTGLGLAVCKELIEKYSGTITAERRQPCGARMTVRIPIRSCAAVPLGKLRGPSTARSMPTASPAEPSSIASQSGDTSHG